MRYFPSPSYHRNRTLQQKYRGECLNNGKSTVGDRRRAAGSIVDKLYFKTKFSVLVKPFWKFFLQNQFVWKIFRTKIHIEVTKKFLKKCIFRFFFFFQAVGDDLFFDRLFSFTLNFLYSLKSQMFYLGNVHNESIVAVQSLKKGE